jgi:hypothetical protein
MILDKLGGLKLSQKNDKHLKSSLKKYPKFTSGAQKSTVSVISGGGTEVKN